ncbi:MULTISPECIES: 3,4-dihydroxy-2-butanone-4-phosphate synthase [Roseobacter]|uniref:3,4-dihydroxy-2-butanone 4-phosphate synthase n=1 Tax=Roseobacter litoralis (strain ATCC 49566 / DSM 6996 / JCM 21268 / NBRC 15278 / OCh 149) TaxID=391595 RepID=F7ZH31_ROSLO|nr:MULTISPECIES: 3,4-dihydroxy-2-butanone-4-phosphate synthase [Roseobacter]AEI94873.1 riboflavin biosynthesis protein [Roseobacter litoralis Och 149]GIT86945.1 3,4-dihydroxy-2-butanone 4-phosphate synthase [Roseobacter sp. OBYS 0001]
MTFETSGPIERELRDSISPIEAIIEDARHGRMFILVDHEDRENEGDLVIPAQFADAQVINFMATHGRGLICLPMTSERIDTLGLPMMAVNNSSRHETAFTVSIEAREGVSTGISAPDRALTVAIAIDEDKGQADIATPGHIFPLRARAGGVLARAGHTEAAVDISRLAGLHPSGVICEIMKPDGEMARLPDLVSFAQEHDLKIGTISDLIAYRHKHDNLLRLRDERMVSSVFGGEWCMRIFSDEMTGTDHVMLSKGDISTPEPVLVRTHALNALEDVLGLGPSPADELPRAMQIIAEEGRGAVLLFREPHPKLRLDDDDEDGPRTIKRTGVGAQIMSTMGLHELILLTDSPQTKYLGLEAYNLSIIGTRPITKD